MIELALPAAVVVGIAPIAALVQRQLAPRTATRVLVVLSALAVVSVAAGATALAFGYLHTADGLPPLIRLCRSMLGGHEVVSTGLGITAFAVLGWMVVAAAIRWRRDRAIEAAFAALTAGRPVTMLQSSEPIACATPGSRGAVVVSTGMLDLLSVDERRAMFAHEQAHVRFRHDRSVRVVTTAATMLPLLRPMVDCVRYATDRWADEVAAAKVGDRALVARAISRAALAGTAPSPAGALGLTGHRTVDRIAALTEHPTDARRWPARAVVLAIVIVSMPVVFGAGLQVHHLLVYLGHMCWR